MRLVQQLLCSRQRRPGCLLCDHGKEARQSRRFIKSRELMKISIILAHPNQDSFNHAIAFRAGTGGLRSAEN
jgi:hypothetical protein